MTDEELEEATKGEPFWVVGSGKKWFLDPMYEPAPMVGPFKSKRAALLSLYRMMQRMKQT